MAASANKGRTIPAIYERDGDTQFKTKEGTQLFLVTYKRERP